jgi:hypothetical protein
MMKVALLHVKEVIRQWLGGASKKRIAARLKLDVKTVRRYVAPARVAGRRPGSWRPTRRRLGDVRGGARLQRREAATSCAAGEGAPAVLSRHRFVYPVLKEERGSSAQSTRWLRILADCGPHHANRTTCRAGTNRWWHPDQHAQVAQALYSLARSMLGKQLIARADRT